LGLNDLTVLHVLSICLQRCKYWFWEDEASGRPSRRYAVSREADSTNRPRIVSSAEVATGVQELKSELLLVRFALLALAAAVVWLASKV
jgi:hypothetical protein